MMTFKIKFLNLANSRVPDSRIIVHFWCQIKLCTKLQVRKTFATCLPPGTRTKHVFTSHSGGESFPAKIRAHSDKPVGGRHSLEVTWPFLFCSQLAQEYSKLSFQPYTELPWFRKFQDDENIIDRIFALSDVDIARMHTTISLKIQFSTC